MALVFPTYVRLSIDGFGLDRATAVNRTDMSDGMVKQLRTKSRVLVTRSVMLLLDSKADYLSFITFFEEDLDKGALWFQWVDPIDKQTKLARFVSKLGKEEMRGGMPNLWQISASIETWSDGL